jgi:hypothetical protein
MIGGSAKAVEAADRRHLAARRSSVRLRLGGGEKIGLLLIVALDRHAVAGLDDRFKQLGRPIRKPELSASAADRSGSRPPRGAIGLMA